MNISKIEKIGKGYYARTYNKNNTLLDSLVFSSKTKAQKYLKKQKNNF